MPSYTGTAPADDQRLTPRPSTALSTKVISADRILSQIALRGAWPHPTEFDWMREQGITWHTMDEVDERGLSSVVAEVIERALRRGGKNYVTVDIDSLDPAYAPGTGTPEPGGLTTRELLRAVRAIALAVDICAIDVVEVCPPYDPSGITALAAHRIILEALSAMALRATGKNPKPQRAAATQNLPG